MPDPATQIAQNLARVRQRMADAAARSGRGASDVALVAVTKYVGPAEARAAVEAGCDLLGESRPQELWSKAEALAGLPVRWHLIGHLQRNKVRRTLPLVTMVESADSVALVAAMDRIAAELNVGQTAAGTLGGTGVSPVRAAEHGQDARATLGGPPRRRVPILLEVNVSRETAKHGFEPEALAPALAELAGFRHVEVRGLMCMAALEGGLDAARRDFAALRQLRDRLRAGCPDGISLDELSMGMSGDFEVAIEEGATMVRVGSALFEGVLP